MLKELLSLLFIPLMVVGCDSDQSATARHVPPPTNAVTTVNLPDGVAIAGRAPLRVNIYETSAGDGEGLITLGAESGSNAFGLNASMRASGFNEESWDLRIGPKGAPGFDSSASVSITRSSGEYDAETGTVHLELQNGRITGRVEAEPGHVVLTFEGPYTLECEILSSVGDSDSTPTRAGDEHMQSDFCQPFASLVPGASR